MKNGRVALIAAAFLLASTPLLRAAQAAQIDAQIESSAKQSYAFRNYLQDDAVQVKSENGHVTLSGTVKETSDKSLAEETVSNLPGVKKVNNYLEVQGEPDERTDAWLVMKAKAALLFHRNVSASKTQITVEDGKATLRGEADSQAQKDLTAEYVKGIEGITAVENEITVNQAGDKAENRREQGETFSEKIDDASITAQAKLALLFNRSTSALKTKVETKDGVVTLSGEAKNTAEKDLAAKIISDIHGVRRVSNQMTVA